MEGGRKEEIAVGLLLAVGLAVAGWLAVRVGAVGSFEPQVQVQLRIDDAAGLGGGVDVAVSGVKVGRLTRLALEDGRAVATLSLDQAAGLRRDVTPRVRSRSVLGEKYLELLPGPGDAPLLEDGDVLELPGDQLELDEVMARLGPLFDALDPVALAAAIRSVSDALAEDPDRVRRVLEDAERLVANAAEASEELPGLLGRAEGTLDRADRALASLDARLGEARRPLERIDGLLVDVAPAAQALPDTLAEARAAVAELRALLDDAGELVGDEGDLARVLANFAEIDKWELRRLLREEGILIRLKAREVEPSAD